MCITTMRKTSAQAEGAPRVWAHNSGTGTGVPNLRIIFATVDELQHKSKIGPWL
jgi:hypothetical protein